MDPGLRTCHICDKVFGNRSKLKRHLKEVHFIEVSVEQNKPFSCTLCEGSLSSFLNYKEHLALEHHINLNSEVLEFETQEEFYSWKKNIENSNNVSFVKKSGSKKRKEYETIYFQCKRSGIYKPSVSPNDRKRHLKIQGSCKINGICPSRIKVNIFEDSKVTVDYCQTHVGHSADLAHKQLSQDERKMLASLIANHVPFRTILNEAQSTLSESESLNRIHLLTRQDLHNVVRDFDLNCEKVLDPNDATSVDAWVLNNKLSNNNSVLLYKPQGEEDHVSHFKSEDFALGIMSEAQQEMLLKYGNDCICIDGTHGLNGYDFEVVTIMVIDDLRKGFPCAYFISNRTDAESMQSFLMAIREKIGLIKPRTFMSDMAESFYNAWQSIMGPVENRLFCAWHVIHAWIKNLKAKIKDSGARDEAFKKLMVLLEETDRNTFHTLLDPVIEDFCQNEQTKEYGEYFRSEYKSSFKSWAYCYRNHLGVNTNMRLESMHRQLKYSFLNGKTVKRLDIAINALMNLVKQRLFDRLVVMEKGPVCTKLKILRKRHKQSLTMTTDLIVPCGDSSWEIASSASTSGTYIVKLGDVTCECHILCNDCKTCIHKYLCECIDCSIKGNMCKHVHLLCRKQQLDEIESNKSECVTETNNSKITGMENEKNVIIKELISKKEGRFNFEEEKMKLNKEFMQALEKVKTSKDLLIARRVCNYLNAKLGASQSGTVRSLLLKRKITPKNIVCQRKKFATTKKKKKVSQSLKKPNRQEAIHIALNVGLQSSNSDVQ